MIFRSMNTLRETIPPTPTEAYATVRELNQEYIDAVRARDAGWLEQHLSEDVVVIFGNGKRVRKPGFLAAVRDEPKDYQSLTCRDVTVRVFGETVQVDADALWELRDGSHGVSRYIDTYAWIDGRWQVISAQITWLPPS